MSQTYQKGIYIWQTVDMGLETIKQIDEVVGALRAQYPEVLILSGNSNTPPYTRNFIMRLEEGADVLIIYPEVDRDPDTLLDGADVYIRKPNIKIVKLDYSGEDLKERILDAVAEKEAFREEVVPIS